jgi:hypothetical protein
MAAEFPTTIDALEASWLTERLRAAGVLSSEGAVTGFSVEPVAEGVAFTSRLYRLHLQLEGPGDIDTLVIKLPVEGAEGLAVPMYRSEVTFYRDFSGWMPIRAPRLYFGDMTKDASGFVLLLEDVVGHAPADQIRGFSLEQIRSAIRLLADFHAANWEHDRLERYRNAFPPMRDSFIVSILPHLIGLSWAFYLSVARVQPSSATRKLMERFTDVLDPVLEELSRPLTLLHGDTRGDNWFFDDRHEARVLDFQLVTQAGGMIDVAYLASQSLAVETRRAADRDLVEHYVSCLSANGIEGYGFESAWRQYRLATYLMIFMPLVAINAWERTNERGRDLCLLLMERALAAIEDLDVGALLPP